jgi:hypothetical protein
MLRTIIVLFLLGLGIFYFHQKQQIEIPSPHQELRILDDTIFITLKQSLPSVTFEKDIQPIIERNQSGGLNNQQIDTFLKKLDTIGKALGGKTAEAVNIVIPYIAPDIPPQKTLMQTVSSGIENLVKKAISTVYDNLPYLQGCGSDILHGLTLMLSQLLTMAADLLES